PHPPSPPLFPYTTLFRSQAMLDRHALFHPEPLHEPLHAVGAEDAQEVVLEREVEAGRARVALPAAAAAELVVDPARFVPLDNQLDRKSTRLNSSHVAISY